MGSAGSSANFPYFLYLVSIAFQAEVAMKAPLSLGGVSHWSSPPPGGLCQVIRCRDACPIYRGSRPHQFSS
jgi:hypothetical protein